jgi:hypothetical protein
VTILDLAKKLRDWENQLKRTAEYDPAKSEWEFEKGGTAIGHGRIGYIRCGKLLAKQLFLLLLEARTNGAFDRPGLTVFQNFTETSNPAKTVEMFLSHLQRRKFQMMNVPTDQSQAVVDMLRRQGFKNNIVSFEHKPSAIERLADAFEVIANGEPTVSVTEVVKRRQVSKDGVKRWCRKMNPAEDWKTKGHWAIPESALLYAPWPQRETQQKTYTCNSCKENLQRKNKPTYCPRCACDREFEEQIPATARLMHARANAKKTA